MPAPTDKAYTCDHRVNDDGSVTFKCSQDEAIWPWLELPAWHPVAMQTINYWVSVECSAARGTFDRNKWSALTWMDWKVGDFHAGIPAHGKMENTSVGDKIGFLITLYDEADRLIYTSRGKGVVFRTRDFEGWRNKAKQSLLDKVSHDDFAYANAAKLGIGEGEFPLVSPLGDAEPVKAFALVTPENGMPPMARFLDGSGDHVNAAHLAECGRQFVALLMDSPEVRFPGGEITFTRYVEFSVPMEIELVSRTDSEIHLVITQAGKPCCSISLKSA